LLKNSWVAAQLAASQEGLSSMELVVIMHNNVAICSDLSAQRLDTIILLKPLQLFLLQSIVTPAENSVESFCTINFPCFLSYSFLVLQDNVSRSRSE
jgi:hypothetical protein